MCLPMIELYCASVLWRAMGEELKKPAILGLGECNESVGSGGKSPGTMSAGAFFINCYEGNDHLETTHRLDLKH